MGRSRCRPTKTITKRPEWLGFANTSSANLCRSCSVLSKTHRELLLFHSVFFFPSTVRRHATPRRNLLELVRAITLEHMRRVQTHTHTYTHALPVGGRSRQAHSCSIPLWLTGAAGAGTSQVLTTLGLKQAPFGASGLVSLIPDMSCHACSDSQDLFNSAITHRGLVVLTPQPALPLSSSSVFFFIQAGAGKKCVGSKKWKF